MRLRRVPRGSIFFSALGQLAEQIEQALLILAEQAGADPEDRAGLQERIDELCEASDESCHLVARQLRENYVTPLDREDLFDLAQALREITHRLSGVALAIAQIDTQRLPSGVDELLAVLSNQSDQTRQMTGSLSSQPAQWEYADAVISLAHRASTVRVRMVRPSALDKKVGRAMGTHVVAVQLGLAAEGFAAVGRICSRIAAKES